MSFDISQFHQVFFEEAAEHLGNLESLLLSLDRENPDPEELNAIFRAAHSIKGSAGTFGFQDLAEVTHVLETLLDRLRNGEMQLTEAMVDAFLVAGDVLADMLAEHKGEGTADRDAVAAICARLKALTTDDGEPEAHRPMPAVPAAQAGDDLVPAAPALPKSAGRRKVPETEVHRIAFHPTESLRQYEPTREAILAGLRHLGSVTLHQWGPNVAEGEPWLIELDCDAAGVWDAGDILESAAVSGTVSIDAKVPDGNVATAAADDSWGLFADEPAVDTGHKEEAYGFFDDEPAPAQPVSVAAEAESAYGFFDEAPGVPAANVPAPAEPEASAAEEDARGYGFFTAVPVKPEAPAPTATESVPRADVKDRAAKAAPKGDASIRVGVDKVDQLINLVGELVITQAMLAQSAERVDPVLNERLIAGLGQLERNTRDLQESVMSIRMMPISTVFSRFPRVVRDLSQKLGKQVELVLLGEGTELDKGLIERITDPLTHLVRNSLDHGVEMPEARVAKGKPAKGTITLKASHQGGHIAIEVGDDGAGLNRERILAKARERGLPHSESMADEDVWLLIFEPGFSTAEAVTEVSGRGVGMDVVKRNISALGGRIDIQSMAGVGTRMTVRLPLTLAILDGMSVAIGSDTYIIPLNSVVECLQPKQAMIKSVSGRDQLVQVRGEYLPLVPLADLFGVRTRARSFTEGIVIVLDADGAKAALFVDALVGQQQVVIKSLEANYRRVAGISGATIMGDGHVAMILDVNALVDSACHAMPVAA